MNNHTDVQTAGAAPAHGIRWPRFYDFLLFLLTRGREQGYRRDVLDLAGAAPGKDVLDVGCGTGTQAIAAWRRVQPGGSVAGIDVSDEMVTVARRKAVRVGADIAFHVGTAARLPFADARFDIVTMTTVVHMIAESQWPACLAEAARVLRPGGQILLIDYAGDPASRKGFVASHGIHGRFDLHRLGGRLAEAGFQQVSGAPMAWMSVHYLKGTKP